MKVRLKKSQIKEWIREDILEFLSEADDEKEKRIELAKQRARERIQSMGLDLDQFNI